jgi:hypothetical protein
MLISQKKPLLLFVEDRLLASSFGSIHSLDHAPRRFYCRRTRALGGFGRMKILTAKLFGFGRPFPVGCLRCIGWMTAIPQR